MSIRGHVQIRKPEYGNKCLSSYVSEQALEAMRHHGITVDESVDGERWIVDIDEHLHSFVRYLEGNPDAIEGGQSLCGILNEGICAARREGDSDIIIDWW